MTAQLPTLIRMFLSLMFAMYVGGLCSSEEYFALSQLCALYNFWWENIRPRVEISAKPRLSWETMTEYESWAYFRFKKHDIPHVCALLLIPPEIITKSRYKFSSVEAFLVLCWRLSFPCSLLAGKEVFGRGRTALSEIIHWMLEFILFSCGHLLEFPTYYSEPARLRLFANKINAKCPQSNCTGFLDTTLKRNTRPHIGQQAVYSGYKKIHGMKYQNVITPDGIIATQWGPVEGRRSDIWILAESDLIPTLTNRWRFVVNTPATIAQHTPSRAGAPNMFRPGGVGPDFIQYCVYGDRGYTPDHSGAVVAPFKRYPGEAQLTEAQENYNTCMAQARIAVEWGFLKVVQKWAYLDYHKQMKIWGTPVAMFYKVGSLLTNFHTCLYGSEVSTYFELDPPTLEAYLAMLPPA